MKRNIFLQIPDRQLLLASIFYFSSLIIYSKIYSQENKIPTAVWVLPGIQYQDSSRFRFLGQYGNNAYLSIQAVYLQAFYKAGKHVILNPAYLYLKYPGIAGLNVQEHTLMNAVIFIFPLHQLIIEDRNMIWNRFRQKGEVLNFYRNRLRITRPFNLKYRPLNLYVFDEVWYFINDGKWTRNRLAIGVTYDLTPWFNVDMFFARELNSGNRRINLLFIMGTIKFKHKKAG